MIAPEYTKTKKIDKALIALLASYPCMVLYYISIETVGIGARRYGLINSRNVIKNATIQ